MESSTGIECAGWFPLLSRRRLAVMNERNEATRSRSRRQKLALLLFPSFLRAIELIPVGSTTVEQAQEQAQAQLPVCRFKLRGAWSEKGVRTGEYQYKDKPVQISVEHRACEENGGEGGTCGVLPAGTKMYQDMYFYLSAIVKCTYIILRWEYVAGIA